MHDTGPSTRAAAAIYTVTPVAIPPRSSTSGDQLFALLYSSPGCTCTPNRHHLCQLLPELPPTAPVITTAEVGVIASAKFSMIRRPCKANRSPATRRVVPCPPHFGWACEASVQLTELKIEIAADSIDAANGPWIRSLTCPRKCRGPAPRKGISVANTSPLGSGQSRCLRKPERRRHELCEPSKNSMVVRSMCGQHIGSRTGES